jgi:serine/threonine-protein kinase
MPLRIGETFAGYRVVRLLGSGGMGEVYLVQHPRLPRQEALKILHPDISSDPSFRERFIREADLAAGLRHPHIVGIHDRGEHDGQLWIAMDYVDGTDLAERMTQHYPSGMPIDLVLPIVSAVASALDYAHKKGLLHRDVKPANIMVADLETDDPSVFLADFGIARPLDDTSGITATNMTVGTLAYGAPEQLMGEQIDGRADQYALAATAFHLLSGAQLFPHTNPAVVISRHLSNPPPALAQSRPELAGLDSALSVALAKRPEDRFTRCSDFARALAERGSTSPMPPTKEAPVRRPSHAASPASPPQERIQVAHASRRWAVTAAAAVVLMSVLGVVLVWRPWVDHSTESSTTHSSQPFSAATLALPTPPLPPPPSFSPKAIDGVLLTANQLSKLLGADVTDDPSAAGGGGVELSLNASSYGTSDHSGQVTPRSCVGVVFTAEHEVYAGNEPIAMKTQTFGHAYGGGSNAPHLIDQAAAVFASAEQAQAFLASSQQQWETCAKGEVDATLGYENGAGYVLGGVRRDGDVITVSMATNGGLNGPDACQQALGVRENVVVESRSCETPDVTNVYDPVKGFTRDPGWASPWAQRIALAMMANVIP